MKAKADSNTQKPVAPATGDGYPISEGSRKVSGFLEWLMNFINCRAIRTAVDRMAHSDTSTLCVYHPWRYNG